MRNLSAAAINAVRTRLGTEPIVIIKIAWDAENEHMTNMYADRDIGTIPGKILDVSTIDNVISIDQSEDSAEMDITLDDTDGSIKAIMNEHDIHKRDVWVYHWFEGLDLADKFLLIRGKISSPVSWNEGERSVSFSVVTQIEDKEVGFSPEEGQFPFVPKDMVGTTWPSIFGTPYDVPAVQCNRALTGTTLCPVSILTGVSAHLNAGWGSNPPDFRQAQQSRQHYDYMFADWYGVDDDEASKALDQVNEISNQIVKTAEDWYRSQMCALEQRYETVNAALAKGSGCNPIHILGGEDFPRGGLTLQIGGGIFVGHFGEENTEFDDKFYVTNKWHAPSESASSSASQDRDSLWCKTPPKPANIVKLEGKIPCVGSLSKPPSDLTSGKFMIAGDCVRRTIRIYWYNDPEEDTPDSDVLQHFWGDAGSQVSIVGDEPITYIVSIVPGTVLTVKAFKDFHGIKILSTVPTELYEVKNVSYGPIDTVQVVLTNTLSLMEDENWSDDLYVTFESDVGPNICDILIYLIDVYSDMTYDPVSFAEVGEKLDIFPANFALLERKNLVSVLNEIAFQARCSLRLIDGVFYIRYLAEEPTAVDTITEQDIETNTISMELTSTENLVTKYTATWRLSYAQPELNKLILRHNIRKYGIQEEEYEYYIYHHPDTIYKIATFWLIRKSNTWKRLSFKTFLNKMNLEAFDAVTLSFQSPYIANGDIKATVEVADLETSDQSMSLNCWLPVKSGEMEAYDFAWPANVNPEWVFPTSREIDLGLAGGDGPGAQATGDLPVGYYESLIGEGVVYVGGPAIGLSSHGDYGDRSPSDWKTLGQKWSPQPVGKFRPVYPEFQSKPVVNTRMSGRVQIPDPEIPTIETTEPTTLYIENTRIRTTEKDGEENWASLEDVFRLLPAEKDVQDRELQLVISDEAYVGGEEDDEEKPTKQFDFQYDDEGELWGCGTCYLQAGEE